MNSSYRWSLALATAWLIGAMPVASAEPGQGRRVRLPLVGERTSRVPVAMDETARLGSGVTAPLQRDAGIELPANQATRGRAGKIANAPGGGGTGGKVQQTSKQSRLAVVLLRNGVEPVDRVHGPDAPHFAPFKPQRTRTITNRNPIVSQ